MREQEGCEGGEEVRTYDLGNFKNGPKAGWEFGIVDEVVGRGEETTAFGEVPADTEFIWGTVWLRLGVDNEQGGLEGALEYIFGLLLREWAAHTL
jgi:hypothetical protein